MGTPVNLSPVFNAYQSFLNTGLPNNGGLINTYLAGGAIATPTYQESTGTTQNSNPIVLSSAGRPPAEIWLPAGVAFKFVLTDSLGNLLGTYDNITASPNLGSANSWTGMQTFFGGITIVNTGPIIGGVGLSFSADFSNATVPLRFLFRSSTTNGQTDIGAVPNGASTTAGFSAIANSAAANCPYGRFAADAGGVSIESNVLGAGAQGPLRFYCPSEVGRFSVTNNQFLINTTTESPVTGAKMRVNGIVAIDNSCAIIVNRNNVNQGGVASGVFTQIALTTKALDQNTNFNTGTYRWTPPAGTYFILGIAQFTALTGVARTAALIYKNGAAWFTTNVYGTAGQASGAPVGGVVVANGTDYFELFVWHNSGGAEVINGATLDCYLTGYRIG